MCQICNLDTASKRYIWPVPTREHVAALQGKVPSAKDTCHKYRSTRDTADLTDLIQQVDALYTNIKTIDTARETWWLGKRDLREGLTKEIEYDRQKGNFKAATQGEKARQKQKTAQEKMNDLQAINTRATDMLRDMRNTLNMLARGALQMSPSDFPDSDE